MMTASMVSESHVYLGGKANKLAKEKFHSDFNACMALHTQRKLIPRPPPSPPRREKPHRTIHKQKKEPIRHQ